MTFWCIESYFFVKKETDLILFGLILKSLPECKVNHLKQQKSSLLLLLHQKTQPYHTVENGRIFMLILINEKKQFG